MDAVEAAVTIACPASPDNGRTLFKGHLFVGDTLLGESGMRHHPLTHMTDSNLVLVLQRQTNSPVGLIPFSVVAKGASALSDSLHHVRTQGTRIDIVHAVSTHDLLHISPASAEPPLST